MEELVMTNRFIKSSRCASLSFSGVCASLILLGAMTAQGATYYVATTGNDSNSGTSSSPWRHPQRCTTSPIRAGDTCIVRAGTYTDTNGDGVVVYVKETSPDGTASQPITIKSEKPHGAVIVAPSNRTGFGFMIQSSYYVIEGFDISGANFSGSSAAGIGVNVRSPATGVTIRSNSIHHIGRQACTNSSSGFAGVQIRYASSIVVERNRIYSIGRRRNGESGCSTIKYQHDHGIYITGSSNVTARRNVIYDTNRGYPIHVYGGTTTNLNIYHNTLAGRSPIGKPIAHILLASTIKTAHIKNNISSDALYGMIYASNLTASNVTASYNMSNTITNAMAALKLGNSGITFSNNIDKTSNLGFANKSTNDFRLVSGSPAINRGTTSGVPPVPDGAPDTSAYEYSSQNTLSSPLTPTGLRTL
jgi:hypothetical protein